MARIAATKSDLAIFTSDNPRDEDPMTILAEMEAGITGELMEKSITIPDRKEAIITACQLANSNDIVAVAGKGHEDYQEIKGQRLPFDDKKILTAEL
jgi:UDP-N-acetylmuramoyl-L-alanyl-D-glutamate--2,6-diaminopimelate ligase